MRVEKEIFGGGARLVLLVDTFRNCFKTSAMLKGKSFNALLHLFFGNKKGLFPQNKPCLASGSLPFIHPEGFKTDSYKIEVS